MMYECRTDEMRAARVADTVHGFVIKQVILIPLILNYSAVN